MGEGNYTFKCLECIVLHRGLGKREVNVVAVAQRDNILTEC